ncbi:hypothetical protein SHANETTE_56 [Bacillus phage Shanette]|uniref:Uncharacterized protein n=2 Tax=Siminovitchvirus TaxID=1918721 RepID=S5MAE5_9CAUD|nr:hypothetical protein AVV47_gp056 [Bacillus phage JL]YP_009216054.1 hypothetical protein AVV46_gp056 [Bacillus phage Shanette]AGR46744.1 hypothetical protein JL_56 [Bacillus phage JL]AGR46956.1 hypothetical protein SHANETTE_56 [Bacillus phage Shanette]
MDKLIIALIGLVAFLSGILMSYFDTGVARAIGIVIVACCLFLFCITLLYGWEKRERK